MAIIAHLHGRACAHQVAQDAEHVWNDDPDHAPFARASG